MVKIVESFKLRGYGVIVQNLDVTEEYNYYYYVVVVYEGDDVVTAVVCMLCVCVCLVCVAHCHSLSWAEFHNDNTIYYCHYYYWYFAVVAAAAAVSLGLWHKECSKLICLAKSINSIQTI